MRLNINRFAGDPFQIDWSYSNVDIDSNNTVHGMSLTVYSMWHDISNIYIINSDDSRNWDTYNWEIETYSSYPWASAIKTITSTDGIKGFRFAGPNYSDGSPSSNDYQDLFFDFTITPRENDSTTYLTKTSATAVLKGNVLNSLNTYDWNNAPSVAAVRNYLESGSAIQSQKEWLKSLILETTHPIGSLEINTSGTNPSEYLGGVWESFGSGRTLVGVDSSDSDFDTAEETGGEKTHTLTTNEIPAHTHGSKSLVGTWANWGEGSGMVSSTTNGYKVTGIVSAVGDNNQYGWGTSTGRDQDNTSLKIDATHEHNSVGGGQAHNNLQPYITVYFWKRVS